MKAFTRTRMWFVLFVAGRLRQRPRHGPADRPLRTARTVGRRHGPPGPPPSPADSAARVARDLGLTAEQEREVRAAFERGAARLNEFRARTGQEFDGLLNELNADIERTLRPEQRERFRAHLPERSAAPPATATTRLGDELDRTHLARRSRRFRRPPPRPSGDRRGDGSPRPAAPGRTLRRRRGALPLLGCGGSSPTSPSDTTPTPGTSTGTADGACTTGFRKRPRDRIPATDRTVPTCSA